MEKSTHGMHTFMEDDSTIDIKQEITRYLRYWPWFIFAVFITICSAYFYLRYAPRIYETTAKIKILDESEGLELPTAALILNRSNINLENEIEILSSYLILERVVRDLNLTTKFFEEGTIQTSPLEILPFEFEQLIKPDSISEPLGFKIDVNTSNFTVTNLTSEEIVEFPKHSTYGTNHELPFEIRQDTSTLFESIEDKTFLVYFNSVKNTILGLKAKLEISALGDRSDLLQLKINGESTEISEQIINAIIRVFDEDGINDRQLVSKRTLDFIDERFLFLAKELDDIEIERQEFKQRNNLVDLVADAGIGLEQRTESDAQVFTINYQLTLAQDLKNAITKDTTLGLLPSDIGLESNGVTSLISDYNTAVLNLDKLKSSAGGNNPTVKVAETSIAVLKRNINRSLASYVSQLEISQSQLQTRNNRFRGQVAQIPEKEKLLLAIERQQKIKESIYLLLLQKREEAAINLAITEPSIKVVENALSGYLPISPKSKIVYAGALLAGLLMPFGFLYVLFMLDTKLHTKDDITDLKIDIPVIGEIPEIKNANTSIFKDPNDRSVLAESFRILSANVDYILPIVDGEKGKVIYCTSTIKGEGKTYISVNLSLALSSINKKVLLIGSDLRNPQIHTLINEEKHKAGLSNYLHDPSFDWKAAIVKGFEKHPNHDLILSGSIPPNPAHLLTNGRFKKLIEEAKQDYDYIIVDTAPTILV
ncbi:polysaccharide biosynthesis tyrosine autokinase, partial [Winogradskyella sp.]|nr:polysaccharide biosynthesis tyrosine autokinase [Winogradskyella sp.]